MRQHRAGFTLVEILVVLAVIAILSALLFPVFNRARERGRQTNCASNLATLYQAINLYYQDEKRYPGSILDLLPNDVKYPKDANGGDVATNLDTATGGGGYLRGGRDALLCPSDDTESPVLRSSYGNLAGDPTVPSGKFKNGLDTSGVTPDADADPSRFVYNAFGYDAEGWAYSTPTEALTAVGTSCSTTTPCPDLVKPTEPYHVKNNPIKYSLSNRSAPPQTIITHCIFHRTWTGNVDFPGQVYNPTFAQESQGARDIVLRLDGKAKLVDVSSFKATPNLWQQPTFN